ncbi:MAG: hypothetical protein HY306_07980 [Nitrosomonadales bacterium]|nr:hypothetical protein [Nitrosomonadales bacterium]
MIFDMNDTKAMELLDLWQSANKEANLITTELSDLIKSRKVDTEIAKQLSERMEIAHNKAMDILDELQQFRLDD